MPPASSFSVMDRRREGKRLAATLPFSFSSFSHSPLHSKHEGLICNQSPAGACFLTNQKCLPGTIVFMRDQVQEADLHPCRTTRLAEIRWCQPARDRNPAAAKWSIGVRYL